MIKTAHQLLYLFVPPAERRKLAVLMAALTLTALVEVLGVASIMPFMAVVARPEVLTGNGVLASVYEALSFQSTMTFLIAAAAITLATLVLSNIVSALGNWLLFRFTYVQAHMLSARLLSSYMARPYTFFLEHNTSELSKNVLAEVNRVTAGALIPALQLFAKLIVTVMLISVLVVAEPILALTVAAAVSVSYAIFYSAVRRWLLASGKESTIASEACHRFVLEALSGIKDIKISGREDEFQRRFITPSLKFAKHSAAAQAISLMPRYVLETIAFGVILSISLYLVVTREDSASVIPTVALYAFAGYRLMPALQQIYSSLAIMRFNAGALTILYKDLINTPKQEDLDFEIDLNREIRVDHLTFAYAGSAPVLKDLSLAISANTTVAFTGISGSGKTTLVDVLLGLLPPQSGRLLVDDIEVGSATARAWRRRIGYVPQQIYLSDDTLAANIAFGIAPSNVDKIAVEKAGAIAGLESFIQSLPKGYDTQIGERGVRLSGGQRQRIGIARALYGDPSVLILDEATSALDGITENAIMDALGQLTHKKTIIIIAHRLSTVQQCDVIHLLHSGRIVSSGRFADLMEQSPDFRKLAHAAQAGELP